MAPPVARSTVKLRRSSSRPLSLSELSQSKVRLLLICIVANMGGFLAGIHLALFSGILEMPHFESAIAPGGLSSAMKSVISTAILAGFCLASPIAGPLADRVGRRGALLLTALLFTVASTATYVSNKQIHLIISRLLAGVAFTITNVVSPMYTAEISPPNMRGMLVNLYQLSITIGVLFAQVCNYIFSDGPWYEPVWYSLAPSIMMTLLVWLMVPESPTWLASKTNKPVDIESAMKNKGSASTIEKSDTMESEKQLTVRELLIDSSARRRLLIGAGLFTAQQWSGINAVIFFGPTLVSDVLNWEGTKSSLRAAVFVGLANVLATVLSVVIVDRFGRRTLLLAGSPPIIICLMVLAAMKSGYLQVQATLGIASLVTYIIAFAAVYGPLPFVICSEIFPVRYKGLAMSLCSAIQGISSMIVGLTFLPMLEVLGGGVYLIYATCMLATFVFVKRIVPETRKLSLQEIDEMLEKRMSG